jgi:lipid-binding SYLF domain-containing protein
MHPIRSVVLAAVVVSCGLATTAWGQTSPSAANASDEAKLISDSTQVLQELTRGADRQIPEHLLARAEAVVVIPSLIKGGFIVGAKHGKGLFAGATLEGAALHSDDSANKALYGLNSLRDVLGAKPASAPAPANAWRTAMKALVTAEPNP